MLNMTYDKKYHLGLLQPKALGNKRSSVNDKRPLQRPQIW